MGHIFHPGVITMTLKQGNVFLMLVLGCLVFSGVSQANSLQTLERQCETARERLIAPQRQQAINQCMADRASGNRGSRSSRDARDHCERFYADFGQGGRTQSGGFRKRMFHDIPECQAFYEAERVTRRR
jgi:hypothetical protein